MITWICSFSTLIFGVVNWGTGMFLLTADSIIGPGDIAFGILGVGLIVAGWMGLDDWNEMDTQKVGRHERCPDKYRMEGSRFPNWACPLPRDHQGDCEPVTTLGIVR